MKIKIYLILSLLALQFILCACPHAFYKRSEDMEKQMDSLRHKIKVKVNPSNNKYTYTPDYLKNQSSNKNISADNLVASDSIFLKDYNQYIAELAKKDSSISKNLNQTKRFKNLKLNKDTTNYTSIDSATLPNQSSNNKAAIDTKALIQLKKDSIRESELETSLPNPINIKILGANAEKYPDEISIRAKIFDYSGKSITNLAPPYADPKSDWRKFWKPLIDSSACFTKDIKEFEVEEIREDKAPPYLFCFVLDNSGSMSSIIDKLNKSVSGLFDYMQDKDWVSVIRFANSPFVEVPPTKDTSVYYKQFNDGKAEKKIGGGTDIIKALNKAIDTIKGVPDSLERVIILFSDGESSSAGLDKMILNARKNRIRIYTIGYLFADEEFMTKIAKFTDARYYNPLSTKEFPYIFRDIYLNLKNHYKIKFKPPKCASNHKVNVTLNFPFCKENAPIDSAYYDCSLFKELIGDIFFANIEFQSGKADIEKESEELLNQIAQELKEKNGLKLKITGHTDDVGSEESNLMLSQNRAKSVKEYLVKRGIESKRLETEGKGEKEPLVPNDSPENRKKNRRTEFLIIDKKENGIINKIIKEDHTD